MPDNCDSIRSAIADLEIELSDLQEQLHHTTPSQKGDLNQRINEIQQNELPARRAELDDCLARLQFPSFPDFTILPRIPGLVIVGWELNQGLPDYELTAGKDTLLRIFITPSPIPTGSFGILPQLDYVSLRVTGPGGIAFEIPGRIPPLFNNSAQSFSESLNINFYLSGRDISRVGEYFFEAIYVRNGNPPWTHSLGSRSFLPTRDLRLLIVIENTEFITQQMSEDAWDALDEALLLVNRNFPMRTGVGPLDGNQENGLRYQIDSDPRLLIFDGNLLALPPLVARLNDFNARQAARGRPDQADKIMTVRKIQPGEAGTGGNARDPLASVTYRPGGSFVSIVCQEIGHLFGASVIGLPASVHTSNRRIPDPSAFDIPGRRQMPFVQPFMQAQVGNFGNDVLFETEDWKVVRQGLARLNSTGPA